MASMSGNCENCRKEETCEKLCGIMFGFCNTDFAPKENENEEE